MSCRICLDDGGITPCNCSGTSAHVHEECLQTWIETSGNTHCEICMEPYVTHKICKCRVKRCLRYSVMCIHSENRKVDGIITSFCILFSVVMSCLLPSSDSWINSVIICFAADVFVIFLIYFGGAKFYPLQVISTFTFLQSITFTAVYFIQRKEYLKLCSQYCSNCSSPCMYYTVMNKNLTKMTLALIIQYTVTGLASIQKFIDIMSRTCIATKIKSQEQHSLL